MLTLFVGDDGRARSAELDPIGAVTEWQPANAVVKDVAAVARKDRRDIADVGRSTMFEIARWAVPDRRRS
jgi:hypothetical protein